MIGCSNATRKVVHIRHYVSFRFVSFMQVHCICAVHHFNAQNTVQKHECIEP